MGRIQFRCGARFAERELAWTTVIGRHWSCDVCLPDEDVPLRWLELRWIQGRWGWRALSREGDTIGPSAWLRPGWRELDVSRKNTCTLRLRQVATVELVDPSAPQPFALDLRSGRLLLRQQLQETLAEAGIHQWRTPAGDPLGDGNVLVLGGRPLRLHLPQKARHFVDEAPSILHTDTLLKLDQQDLEGAVEIGSIRVELAREMVRVLLPYAEARINEYQFEDAWLTREEAHSRWLELGGNPGSPDKRLGWIRGKIKSHLARSGVADVDGLFESQRVGQWYGTRIGLSPQQIIIT